MNDIDLLKNMLNTNKKNRRGNYEIKFEVNSNYYKAIENLLKERQADKDRIKELEEILKFKSKKRKNGTMRYKKTNKLNKYGVNGVCQDMRALKRTGEIKYRAYITLFGKQHTLGTHSTLEGAIKARKDGEKMIENILKNKLRESD